MKLNLGLRLGVASCAVLAAMAASPAFAAGTAAGDVITNTVTVEYKVGSVSQTAVTATNKITVDRKVNVDVTLVDTAAVSVSPNQTDAITTFTVQNLSNAKFDFALSVAQQSGGTGAFSANTDNINTTASTIWVETDGVPGFSAGDTQMSYVDELAADAIKTVYVVSTIPAGAVTNDVATVILTANAFNSGNVGSLGTTEIVGSTGANVDDGQTNPDGTAKASNIDTVLADGAGATDSAYQGDDSAKGDYKVLAAAITATKTSKIMSDGINSYPNAKAIPGAIVEYCITVTNSGGAVATNVEVSDPLPATTAPYTTAPYQGDVGNTTCAVRSSGSVAPTVSGQTVSGTIGTLNAGDTKTVVFYAQIQ